MVVRGDTEAQRWERARRLARGEDDPQSRRANQRRLVLAVLSAGLAMVLVLVVIVVIGARHGTSHRSAHHHVAGWLIVLGAAVALAGLGLAMLGLTRTLRAGASILISWKSPFLALRWRERRELSRQVLGKVPVVPEQLDLTRLLAERLCRQQPDPAMYLGLMLIFAGDAIINPSRVQIVSALAYVALFAIFVLTRYYYLRRANAFLAAHGPASARLG